MGYHIIVRAEKQPPSRIDRAIEYKEKKNTKRAVYSAPAIAALALLLIIVVQGLWSLSKKQEEAKKMADQANGELAKLQERRIELQKKVDFLKTDRGMESEIREKFMVGKEGEGVILIVDQKENATSSLAAPSAATPRRSGFFDLFR